LHLGKFAGAHVGCPRSTYGGKNMREWVYSRVKGVLARRIHVLRQDMRSPTVVAPDGDIVRQGRAASCEPPREKSVTTSPVTPDRMGRLPATPNVLFASAARLSPSREKTDAGLVTGYRHRRISRSDSLERTFVVHDSNGD
jgi:hypothetical protein